MFEQEKISQLLDILGNKNRRRIIDLLQHKPCFVTEISDRLSLNPKAVIEHLALMQKEDVISSYQDERRRKYYYLVQDIQFSVNMQPKEETAAVSENKEETLPLSDTIRHLKTLIEAREHLIDQLDYVERDIDSKIEQLITEGQDIFAGGIEAELLMALVYSPLTPIELSDACGKPLPEVTAALRTLSAKGYVESNSGRYALKEAA
ncbi:MAG TPA: ArsR family transcriptional regulator [Methanocorpusculum sp.]|nr:ArsR family transcriptional regulator [Methanocorpusculum sp.]HJJ40397.1 ArsR family transcriptional regulator [Methanocorpusculum sp.]HJJ49692.1 ArsR family transcriptional regulator [Methanocorpusculum sp.]HJJ57630.1 ArsR family transcriptional regulator [Methanocorpusculum sp.]